jgi:biofilm PGA synthesis N-glycosyltransferase PgaC
MRWLFWPAAALIAYVHVGYLGWLWLRGKLRPRAVNRASFEPPVSLLMVVRNEEAVLAEKLRNLLDLDYPAHKRQIIVVSDGSTDETESILREQARNPQVNVLLNQLARGKAQGLNDGMNLAQGEIVVFTDARQRIEPDALRLLMENFADQKVGAVSGELMLGDAKNGETGRGMGLYWQIEKRVRELESSSGSVVGATGALYAARRSLLTELPADTILDDVLIPMNVARQGFRVLFDGRARAWDAADLGAAREFQRKVRTLTGNYQLLRLAPWLLGKENPLRFEFVCHKLLRLAVPFALVATLISSWFIPGAIFRFAFWAQAGFYGLSLLGWTGWSLGPVTRPSEVAYTFATLNLAALVAFANFVAGRKQVWIRSPLPKEVHLR